MKDIIFPALCALCVMSFSSAALAVTREAPEAGSAAEQILQSQDQPINDSWQDNPTPFAY